MRTAVLRVGAPAAGTTDHSLTLLVDDGQARWQERPVALATMPGDLADPTPPTDDAGNEIAPDGIVPYVLGRTDPSATFLGIGEFLARLLLREPIRQAWTSAVADAARDGGLRTFLDIEPERVRRQPWELLAVGQRRLFLDEKNPWLRGTPDGATGTSDFGPLRVLIIVGSRADDLAAEREVAEAQRALAPVGIAYVLREPDHVRLLDAYRDWQPHVVHCIGHGLAGPNGPALLIGQPRWTLERQDIVNWPGPWTARLAFVNACRSGSAGPTTAVDHDAAASLSEAFLERGFSAVVGIQADIDARAAASLSGPFYAAIAQGSPVDVALVAARNAVAANDLGRRDWALPALTVLGDPQHVLAIDRPPPAIDLQAAEEFKRIRSFVDRSVERMSLWRRLDPEGFGLPPHCLTLVRGTEAIGKTWLIWKMLWILAQRGRAVRYVDLQGTNTLNWLDLLRRIRNGSATGALASSLQAGLRQSAFTTFNHTVNAIVRGKLPAKRVAKSVTDQGQPYKAGVEDGVERIFSAFVDALAIVAMERPLVIAVDHIGPIGNSGGLDQGAFRTVVEHLLRPAQQGRIANVRFVVAMTTEEFTTYWPSALSAEDLIVPVVPIELADLVPLARELCLYFGLEPDDFEPVAVAIGRTPAVQRGWSPKFLATVVEQLSQGSGP